MVHEAPDLLHKHQFIWDARSQAQARRRLPEVAPSLGEHARTRSLRGRQEAKDVFEDTIRKGFDAPSATATTSHRLHRSLGRFPWRHFVEQPAGARAAGTRRNGEGTRGSVILGQTNERETEASPGCWCPPDLSDGGGGGGGGASPAAGSQGHANERSVAWLCGRGDFKALA
jgi:hypothetical protein